MRALGFLLNVCCYLGTYGERWRLEKDRDKDKRMVLKLLSLFISVVDVVLVYYNNFITFIISPFMAKKRKNEK